MHPAVPGAVQLKRMPHDFGRGSAASTCMPLSSSFERSSRTKNQRRKPAHTWFQRKGDERSTFYCDCKVEKTARRGQGNVRPLSR